MKFGDFRRNFGQWARRIRHLEWPWLPEADTPIQHFKDVDFFVPYTVSDPRFSQDRDGLIS